MFSRVAFCILLVWAMGVRAQEAPSVVYGTRGGQLVGGAVTKAAPTDFSRLISASPAEFPRLVNRGFAVGDVGIRDAVKVRIATSTGADVAMVLERRMPWQAAGKLAAGVLKGLPLVATGVAIWELYNDLRIRPKGDGTLVEDPGVPPTLGKSYVASTSGTRSGDYVSVGGSPFSACAAYLQKRFDVFNSNFDWCRAGLCSWANAQTPTSTDPVQDSGGCSRNISTYNGVQLINGLYSSETSLSCQTGNPGYDGKCPTGSYTTPISEQAAAGRQETSGDRSKAAGVALGLLGAGKDLAPVLDSPTSNGPSTVSFPSAQSTSTGPGGTTTTGTAPGATITYGGDSYTWNDTTVTTVNGPNGTVVTTTTGNTSPPVEVCGLPGKPPCKIDETGTPSLIPPFSTTPIDATKTSDAAKQDTEIGRVINPGFGWFSVPPMATCAPIAWPGGVQINPCNGIEVVRSIMAYLWALYGAVWSFGVFRRSLPGAA